MSILQSKISPLLRDKIEEAVRRDREPLALLDVDLTLIDNAPRNRAILAAWLHGVRDRWEGAERAMVQALTMPIVFGVGENLSTLGVEDEELRADALTFWFRAFFSGPYCRHDTPLPGAVDAVALLRDAGVTVAYVTARPARMVSHTVTSFQEMGFPVGVPGTILVTKPDTDITDDAHKKATCEWLNRVGLPVLCADNEPGHVNLMVGLCPHARCVLVETRHSASAPPRVPGTWRAPSLLSAVTSDALVST